MPLGSLLACAAELSDEDSELLRKFTSKEGLNYLEKLWFQKVTDIQGLQINHESPWQNATIKRLIKFYLSQQLTNNADYLNSLGSQLLKITDQEGQAVYNTTEDNINNLTKIGFLRQYLNGYENDFFEQTYLEGSDQTRIERISQILMSELAIGFANTIYKHLIVSEYQKLTRQEFETLYRKQHEDDEDTSEKEYKFRAIEKEIDPGVNFLLTKNLLNKQLFFKWEIKLDSEKSNFYIQDKLGENKYPYLSDAVKEFIPGAEGDEALQKLMSWSERNKKLPTQIFNLTSFVAEVEKPEQEPGDNGNKEPEPVVEDKEPEPVVEDREPTEEDNPVDQPDENDSGSDLESFAARLLKYRAEDDEVPKEKINLNLNNFFAYKGISKQDSGRGKLRFGSLSWFKKATSSDYWYGFLQESDLVTKDIEFLSKKETSFQLTQMLGIMPIWREEKITLKGSIFQGLEDQAAWMLYSQDDTLYTEALRYFSDKEEKGGRNIKIVVNNEFLRKRLIDRGLSYIQDDKD